MQSKTYKSKSLYRVESPTVMGQMVLRINNFVSNHPLSVLSFLMIFSALIIFFQFLFQKQIFVYHDIGGDTQSVYYPFFLSLARKLSTGDFSMWDFTHGLGTNIITRQADVGSIFTWLTCALGAGGVKYALVLTQILKILISGYVCYFYLDTFKLSALSKVVFAYTFAFNGFTMLWGQHYFFATASLYTVLVFLAIEKSLVSKKGYLLVAFASFVVMVNTYYLAYMVLLIAAIYALFRLIATYSFKEVGLVAKKIGGLLASVLVGAAMSAFLFLPAVTSVLGTSARIGSSSLIDQLFNFAASSYDSTTFVGIISRIFSNNLMGTTDYVGPLNYYEMPQWFFTSFILFFIFIFVSEIFFDKSEKTKIKVLKLVAFALVLLLAFQPLLSFVLNGFVDSFFRYTYLIMPLFAVCFASVLDKIKDRKLSHGKLQIFGAAIFSLTVLLAVICITNTESGLAKFLGCVYILMTVVLSLIAIIIQSIDLSAVKRIVCIACVALLLVANVGLDSVVTTNARGIISRSLSQIYLTSGNDDVAQALEYIEQNDKSFYRTEKTFQDVAFLNDSMIQGYYGISVYNSVINKNIINFISEFCPDFKLTDVDGYYDFRAVYHNTDFVSLLGVKYILSTSYITDVPEYSYITTFGTVHLYENIATDGIGEFYNNAIDYEEYLLLDDEEKEGLLNDTIIVNELGAAVSGESQTGESSVRFEKPTNSSRINGSVKTDTDGFVFLPIPYEDGWKAYIDGEEAEILKADIAFSAVKVTKGQHEIVFEYNTPGLKTGIVVSIIGLTIFITWFAILFIGERKNRGRK